MPLVSARCRLSSIAIVAFAAYACASAPPAAPPRPVAPTIEQKMAWILRLEDQRMLRDQETAVAPRPALPDLVTLLADNEPRVRRRAALALGRVGLREAVLPLVARLTDREPEVRQMAAFALGLIGDRSARDPLIAALADPSLLVRASSAEALGLVGDPAAAEPLGRLVAQIVESGLSPPSDAEDDGSRDTPAGAFRIGVCALVRLRAYDQLAGAVLMPSGQPRLTWWPVAYALGRLEDKRALRALIALAQDAHPYTRAFAAKGLGALKDRSATAVLLPLVAGEDPGVRVEAIRALGQIGDGAAAAPLLRIVQTRNAPRRARVEAVSALGGIRGPGVTDALLDLVADRDPAIRLAALRSTAALDAEGFITVLSGLDPDPDWTVRAGLASLLGTLRREVALPRLNALLTDADQRVVAVVLASLVRLAAPNAGEVLLDHLKDDDPVVRAASASGIGELRLPAGAQALPAAYQFGLRDATYVARAAAIEAFAKYGISVARSLLDAALADKDWAVRVRAAALLRQADGASDADVRIRPSPTHLMPESYQAPTLVNPQVSTQAFIDTDRGTIQIELAVLDAPLTVENFTALARRGFFTGLTFHRVIPNFVIQGGDPRGDGEGGPGYTIRDELNERPYLRGTVGMALDWEDTGGSQFFLTQAPQPQLDAKYTVFGRVIAGMDVVDQIQQGDVIRGVRIWDGVQMTGGPTAR